MTTRPQDYIPKRLQEFKASYEINTDDRENKEDMKSYLRYKLKNYVSGKDLESAVEILLEKSGGLFLYARFLEDILADIQEGGKGLSLSALQEDIFPNGLDAVYESYFQRLRDNFYNKYRELFEEEMDDKDEKERNIAAKRTSKQRYKTLLSSMVAAREPLNAEEIGSILGLDNDSDLEFDVKEFIGIAQNLLYLGQDNKVRFVHKSMSDWLVNLNGNTPKKYRVKKENGHEILAKWSATNGAKEEYTYRNAIYHWCKAGKFDLVSQALLNFEWVSNAIHKGSRIAVDAQKYFPQLKENRNAYLSVRALQLSQNPLKEHLEELPTQLMGRLDNEHPLYVQASKHQFSSAWLKPLRTPNLISAENPCLMILEGHTGSIIGVAIDSKSGKIVSASHDKTLRIWDLNTGEFIQVLEGHTSSVLGVAIDSKSGKNCFCLW